MCGIFGFTRDASGDTINHLFRSNFERGSRSMSLMKPDGLVIIHDPTEGTVANAIVQAIGSKGKWDLGHFRSPTISPNAKWETHPFRFGEWLVAHNGHVEERLPGSITDSAVIPYHIYQGGWEGLSRLTGTFACWCFDSAAERIYLFRWAAPLYYNSEAFSSTPFDGSLELPEGQVHHWPGMGIAAHFQPKWHPYRKVGDQ